MQSVYSLVLQKNSIFYYGENRLFYTLLAQFLSSPNPYQKPKEKVTVHLGKWVRPTQSTWFTIICPSFTAKVITDTPFKNQQFSQRRFLAARAFLTVSFLATAGKKGQGNEIPCSEHYLFLLCTTHPCCPVVLARLLMVKKSLKNVLVGAPTKKKREKGRKNCCITKHYYWILLRFLCFSFSFHNNMRFMCNSQVFHY